MTETMAAIKVMPGGSKDATRTDKRLSYLRDAFLRT